jgi:hypothetical protein
LKIMGYKISTSLPCKQHFPYGTSFNPSSFIQETKLSIYEIQNLKKKKSMMK